MQKVTGMTQCTHQLNVMATDILYRLCRSLPLFEASSYYKDQSYRKN